MLRIKAGDAESTPVKSFWRLFAVAEDFIEVTYRCCSFDAMNSEGKYFSGQLIYHA